MPNIGTSYYWNKTDTDHGGNKLFAEQYVNPLYGEDKYYHTYGMYSSDGGFVGWSFSALATLGIIFMVMVTLATFLFVYYCIFNRERIVKER